MLDEGVSGIVCRPADGGDQEIQAHERSGDALGSGGLARRSCGGSFPICKGVPRLVGDDPMGGSVRCERTFCRRAPLDTTLRDRISEEAFRIKTRWKPGDVCGKLVLDVGCGMECFADAVVRGGGCVVGVELSHAVDSAQADVAATGSLQALQAGVFGLLSREGALDVTCGLAEPAHTPDLRRAFSALAAMLREGGEIAMWVYSTHPCPADGMQKRRAPDTLDWYSPRSEFKYSCPEVCRCLREAGLTGIVPPDHDVADWGRKPADCSTCNKDRAACVESLA